MIDELRGAGCAFEAEWFAPALRVPLPADRRGHAGAASTLELRQAIEPWHVLGEEATSGGHGAVRRFVGRAAPGQGPGADRRRGTWSPATAAACRSTRPGPTASSSRASATAPGSPRRACTRPSRCTRPLVFDLWRHLDRGGRSAAAPITWSHPGGRSLRHLPGQRQRGRGPPARPVLPVRPHAGHRWTLPPPERHSGRPVHARPAPAAASKWDRSERRPATAPAFVV